MRVRAGTPLYVSKGSARSLWQTYRIFPDRIELQFWFALHTLVISAHDIVEVEVRHPPVLSSRDCADPPFYGILKLDWADFCRHVALSKDSGFFRQYRFTPDDPEAFVEASRRLAGH